MGNINQTVCGSVKPHLTMTAKERMKDWESLSDPKPDWETFKRMMSQFNDNKLVVRTMWLKKNTSTNLIIEPATLATPDPECCEHCNLFDVFSKGLCQGCFEDQYSDGARW